MPLRPDKANEETVPGRDDPDADVSAAAQTAPPVDAAANRRAAENPDTLKGGVPALAAIMRDGFFVGEIVRDAPGGRAVDFRFVELNPAFEPLTGIAPASAAGRTVREVIPDIPAGMIEVCGHVVATGQPVDFEIVIGSLDNRSYEARAFRVAGEGRFGVMLRETTAARRLAAQSRDSEARLQLMQDAAGLGSWDWDLATGRLRWSRQMYALFGRPVPRASLGEIPADTMLSAIHPDDRERVVEELRQTTNFGAAFRSEFRITTPAAEVRWLAARARVVSRDSTYVQGRLMGVVRDITEQRRLGDELSRVSADFEGCRRERDEVRDVLRSHLVRSERPEVLGRLLPGVAHGFNNTLQAVQGVLDLIRRRGGDAEAVRRYAQLGIDAAQRGSAMTRRVLGLSRPADAGGDTFDAAVLLAEMRETLTHMLGSSTEIRLSIADAVPPIAADKVRLETVLLHLAARARDAMPSGGVLTLAALPELGAARADTTAGEERALPQSELAPGAFVRIAVIDNGRGLDAATLGLAADPHLVTAVGRVDALALAMARVFAEEAGGVCDIESTPKRGTVVSMYLPNAAGRIA